MPVPLAGNRGEGESGEGGHFRRGDRAGEDPREHRGGVGQMVAGTPAEWGFGEVRWENMVTVNICKFPLCREK